MRVHELKTWPTYWDAVKRGEKLFEVRETGVWAPHHKWAGKPVWDAELVDIGDSDSAEPFCDPADADEDDGVVIVGETHCAPALALLASLIKSKMEMENEKDSDDV